MMDSPSNPTVDGLHRGMVDRLVERGWIKTRNVESAFRAIPRHRFLPGSPVENVYSGEAIVTRRGQDGLPISSSSEPAIMAVMLEQLLMEGGARVLEIGAGTGYNAALLSHLSEPDGHVTTVDLDEDITLAARANLMRARMDRVQVVTGDGWLGWPDAAPYDRIEATVGVWDLSHCWPDQLSLTGILVVPLWLRSGIQASVAFRKDGDVLRSVSVEPCGFMRLRGSHRGPEAYAKVDGWSVAIDRVDDGLITIIGELLSTTPRIMEFPLPKARWYVRLALEEPGAVSFQRVDDGCGVMAGILDADEPSLAVVEGDLRRPDDSGRILVYGEDRAWHRLREWLVNPRPLDLRALQIEALPAGGRTAQTSYMLKRREFDFLVRPRS